MIPAIRAPKPRAKASISMVVPWLAGRRGSATRLNLAAPGCPVQFGRDPPSPLHPSPEAADMLEYPASTTESVAEPDSRAYANAMAALFALAILYAIAAYVQWTAVFPWLGRLFS